MIEYNDIRSFLDEALIDSDLIDDLREILLLPPAGVIQLDSGEIHVDPDCKIEIVSKACTLQNLDRGFGTCFSVLTAIGGVSSFENGIAAARYCFAVLWYSEKHELITIDFSLNSP